ncbi:Eukaryotic translation initiation factor 2-alpha kinase [Gaertneriomyces sp. JEL0708]|nr:Eukaryotic translation initiation factor 2-alpha kinase [Gaertneriomyces sp. JEL0708]
MSFSSSSSLSSSSIASQKFPNSRNNAATTFRARTRPENQEEFAELVREEQYHCDDDSNEGEQPSLALDTPAAAPPPRVPAFFSTPGTTHTQHSSRQSRLLLVTLLENFVRMYDADPNRHQALFSLICNHLHSMGIIEQEDFLDELAGVRGAYRHAFGELVSRAMKAVRSDKALGGNQSRSASGTHSGTITPRGFSWGTAASSTNFASFQQLSRYTTEFQEVCVLGRGAYGRVCKAQNKLDGVFYAVKRVNMQLGLRSGALERILREVKVHARLSHPNVVRYFSAWVEDGIPNSAGESAHDGDSYFEGSYTGLEERITEVSDMHSFLQEHSIEDSDLRAPDDDCNDVEVIFESSESDDSHRSVEFASESSTSTPGAARFFSHVEMKSRNVKRGEVKGAAATEVDEASYFSRETLRRCDRRTCRSRVSRTVSNGPITPYTPGPPTPPVTLTLFIQMELCDSTLHHWLLNRNARAAAHGRALDPSDLQDVYRIILDLTNGLEYIHSTGCVHRDIKPKNVLWSDGHWKVGDFGLVTSTATVATFQPPTNHAPDNILSDRARPSSTTGVGTVTYASPEQLSVHPGATHTSASDMYSLGILLYELLCPFGTLMERANALQALRAGEVDGKVEECFPKEVFWVRKCCRNDPQERCSAAQLNGWIRGAMADTVQRKVQGLANAVIMNADQLSDGPSKEALMSEAGDTVVSSSIEATQSENEALKKRIEELEKRLRNLGVADL